MSEVLKRRPIYRSGIILSSKAQADFERLCPELADKLGIGFRPRGSDWTMWFPLEYEVEREIVMKLGELKIPFRVDYAFGPRYVR
jgi:hypothetical protein